MAEFFERDAASLAALLPWPDERAHKYSRGKLVVAGGAAAYPGAAALAARAGQRMGAGYVEVRCASASVPVVQAAQASLVVRSWSDRGAEAASSREACVLGPGFDAADEDCVRVAFATVEACASPLLVDGGALSILACERGVAALRSRAERGLATVLTPHGGEAARLAAAAGIATPARDASDDESANFAAALSRSFGAIVALKGPDTFVAEGARVAVMREGTAALAKAGTGDVLAGMVGALLSQGIAPFDAALLGATLHARAGRVAAERLTAIAVTPEDVVDAIPEAIRRMAT